MGGGGRGSQHAHTSINAGKARASKTSRLLKKKLFISKWTSNQECRQEKQLIFELISITVIVVITTTVVNTTIVVVRTFIIIAEVNFVCFCKAI